MRAKITFDILTCWHAGSGSGHGVDPDAVVAKKIEAVPYLPSTTVKRLFREAVETLVAWKKVEADKVSIWFGGDASLLPADDDITSPGTSACRYITTPATLRFSSAVPVGIDGAWALDNPEAVRSLYAELSVTSIDTKGLADNKAPRNIGVALPITLIATVEAESEGWVATLQEAQGLINSLGSHRSRGLGQVRVTVERLEL